MHPEPFRTYNIDRNINYTNICTSGCRFCAFSRKLGDADAYVIRPEELHQKIEETIALGGNQILLQGGLHPELTHRLVRSSCSATSSGVFPRSTYTDSARRRSTISPRFPGCSIGEVLVRLKRAGWARLPGGGAEILVDRVRREVSPCKTPADRWLEVCRTWHGLGGRGSATMMFGHVETLADRIEHLERLRSLQDETHGFTAFICWTFQPANTALAELPKLGAFDVSENAGRQPAVSRQLRQPPGQLGHAGAGRRPVGLAFRGQRFRQPDDRRKRGGGGRDPFPHYRGRDPAGHRGRRLFPPAEECVL